MNQSILKQTFHYKLDIILVISYINHITKQFYQNTEDIAFQKIY